MATKYDPAEKFSQAEDGIEVVHRASRMAESALVEEIRARVAAGEDRDAVALELAIREAHETQSEEES